MSNQESDPASGPPWLTLAGLALAVGFIFFVPVSNKRHVAVNGAHLEVKTTWQLVTGQPGLIQR
ncbi:MAG TPA: hypothetical protein VFC90_05360 [Planctomycetota bacterium]|nr:hypothetical protein [Planctomycetota bacterium]